MLYIWACFIIISVLLSNQVFQVHQFFHYYWIHNFLSCSSHNKTNPQTGGSFIGITAYYSGGAFPLRTVPYMGNLVMVYLYRKSSSLFGTVFSNSSIPSHWKPVFTISWISSWGHHPFSSCNPILLTIFPKVINFSAAFFIYIHSVYHCRSHLINNVHTCILGNLLWDSFSQNWRVSEVFLKPSSH